MERTSRTKVALKCLTTEVNALVAKRNIEFDFFGPSRENLSHIQVVGSAPDAQTSFHMQIQVALAGRN